ncbi:MAG: hypothetical protein IMZ66_11255, partial [Planctomycetes bacterium]|nr:hypothetical protein [Planctomycetota bacterium]
PDPEARRRIESEELASIVWSIERHLEPLKLSAEVHDTDADLIRLAGEEIARLRRRGKRKKPGTTKGTKSTENGKKQQATEKKKRAAKKTTGRDAHEQDTAQDDQNQTPTGPAKA